jgi:hypothetical protein
MMRAAREREMLPPPMGGRMMREREREMLPPPMRVRTRMARQPSGAVPWPGGRLHAPAAAAAAVSPPALHSALCTAH